MKKKILMFLMATCFMIPCAFLLSACGGNGDKKPSEENAMPVTISFGLSPNWQFGEDWTIDSSTNTYTTTYGSCYWDEYMFNVVATTAEGNTKTMYEATESNPMGYKVDTNLPAEGTYNSNRGIPAGTYTYRLYIEDFNNGYYKAEACSSPTYTIVVNKKVVDCSDVKWVVGQTMEVK